MENVVTWHVWDFVLRLKRVTALTRLSHEAKFGVGGLNVSVKRRRRPRSSPVSSQRLAADRRINSGGSVFMRAACSGVDFQRDTSSVRTSPPCRRASACLRRDGTDTPVTFNNLQKCFPTFSRIVHEQRRLSSMKRLNGSKFISVQ